MATLIDSLLSEGIDRIEQRMRPGQASESGFLNASEKLIDVIQRDEHSLAELSLVPEQFADRLESIVGQGSRLYSLANRGVLRKTNNTLWIPFDLELGAHFLIEGRYLLSTSKYFGSQSCPFEDAGSQACTASTGQDFTIRIVESDQTLSFSGLAIHLIREHHFFEGSVRYRIDPVYAADFLGILAGVDYQPNWAAEQTWDMIGGIPENVNDGRSHPINRASDEIHHVLHQPDRTHEIRDGVKLLFRDGFCVVDASREWSFPTDEVIDGAAWAHPEISPGTWCFRRQEHRFVVPGASSDIVPRPSGPQIPPSDNPPIDVAPFMPEWVKCPDCGKTFNYTSTRSYANGKHVTCGQEIKIVNE